MHPDVLYRVTVGDEEMEYKYYVASNDAQKAYDKIKEYLDKNNFLYAFQRKLKRIDVVATEVSSGIWE